MEIYASRVASFQLSSRKRSKWPHIRPTPKDLAEAGFYYEPSSLSCDNVVCFLCKKSLDGWNVDDDPVKEHIEHSRGCGWAILKYIKLGDKERSIFSEKEVQEAREATFGQWWPHEQKRGWVSKVKKMSSAGFYYNPTPGSNDMVSCIYCGLGLDGWEPKDDPMEEHKKRAPSCFFFQQTNARVKTSEFKVSDKMVQNHDVQDEDALDGDDFIISSKSKTNSLSKTKGRSVVKRSSKKSKDNNLQSRLKKSLLVSCKDDNDHSHETLLVSAIDDKSVLDNSNLIEENNSNDIDNIGSSKETCLNSSHTNSPSSNSEFPFTKKEIIKISKSKNTRQSQQIKKENNLNKSACDHKYNTNINTNATKNQKNGSIIENNKQNDVSIRSNKRLTRLDVKNDIIESYDSEGSQNECVIVKTTSNKSHRKTSSVKSVKSVGKMSLRGMRLSHDNEKKIVSESENQKTKKSVLRPRKSSRINTQIDELEDQIKSIKKSDTKKKPRMTRKTNEIANFKELENAFELTSKLSQVTPLQFVNKGNNYEKIGDSFNRNEVFNNFVMKDSFDDSLQQKSKKIIDFGIIESDAKKTKNISISEVFNNSTDKKTCNWIPIDVENLIFNFSSDTLPNSHELTVTELNMTIEEWIKFITQKQVEKLEMECRRMISILKEEGERAKQAILDIQEL